MAETDSKSYWRPALSLSNTARSLLDMPTSERESAIRERCGGDDESLRQIREKLDLLESIHDPLLRPATEEQLRALLETDPDAEKDALFPARYRIKRPIGRGRFGDVYEAVDTRTTALVALKVIRGSSLTGVGWALVQREIERGQRASHVNIVPILDAACFPESDGPDFYLTMPLVRGARPITEWSTEQPLTIQRKVAAIATLCEAVSAAHSVGVLHGDLSPRNVLVDNSGQIRLVDFGLARELLGESRPIQNYTPGGTPGYMAPELASFNTVAHAAADVFSIGAIAFEVFLSKPVRSFPDRATVAEVLEAVHSKPVDSGPLRCGRLPQDLCSAVARCLAHDPQHRFQSVDELTRVFSAIRERQPVSFPGFHPTCAYLVNRFLRRRPRTIALGAIVILTVLAITGLVGSVVGSQRAERATQVVAAQRADIANSFRTILEGVQPFGRPDLDVLEGLRQSLPVMSGGDATTFAKLSRALALVHWVIGDYPGSNRVIRQGWLETRAHLGDSDTTTVIMLGSLAEGLYHVGEFTEVLSLTEPSALETAIEVLGEDNKHIRRILRSRAVALSLTGRHGEAISLLQNLKLRESQIDNGDLSKDVSAIRTLEYLGEAQLEAGMPLEAESTLREAVRVGSATLGRPDEGLWVSEWIDAHARALLALGRLAEAQSGFEEALSQRLQGLGPMNIETLRSRRGLAMTRFALAENDEQRDAAILEMHRIVAICEELGPAGDSYYLATHRLVLARMLSLKDRRTSNDSEAATGCASQAFLFFQGHGGEQAAKTIEARELLAKLLSN